MEKNRVGTYIFGCKFKKVYRLYLTASVVALTLCVIEILFLQAQVFNLQKEVYQQGTNRYGDNQVIINHVEATMKESIDSFAEQNQMTYDLAATAVESLNGNISLGHAVLDIATGKPVKPNY